MRAFTTLGHLSLTALATSLAIGSAQAQVAPMPAPTPTSEQTPAPAGADQAADIIVTGSLIRGSSETGTSPVEVISGQDLARQGSPSPVELLKTLTVSSGVLGDSNSFDTRSQGSEGIATVNLRGLGPSRTLVLLNSKRLVNAGINVPAVDINLLPLAAIGRVEVLKDGAAATYGSDAIAGVVNFITRINQKGFLVTGDYKQIKGSDGDYGGSISFGHQADGLRLLVAAGYQHRSELRTVDRDFAVQPYANNPEAGFSAGGSPGSFVPVTGGGTPLAGLTVDRSCAALGGTLAATGTLSAPAANGACYTQGTPFNALTDTENRYQIYTEVGIDLTDRFTFEASALYAMSDVPHARTSPSYLLTQAPSRSALPTINPTVGVAGYFVPASNPGYQAYLQQNPGTVPASAAGVVFPLLRFRPFFSGGNPLFPDDFGSSDGKRQSESIRFTAAIKGKLTDDINLDTSFTYHDYIRDVRGVDEFGDRVQLALRGLGGSGCNVAANTPGQNGCIYLNPFGNASPSNPGLGVANSTYVPGVANSTELAQYLSGQYSNKVETQLYVGDVTISGKTGIELPGGALAFAIGGQYRKTKFSTQFGNDSNLAATPCRDTPVNGNLTCSPVVGALGFLGSGRNGSASGNVKAAFAELRAPLFKGLDLQLAARYEDYGGGVGSTFDPKVSARYQALSWLAFRGSYSTTFRGPPDQLRNNTPDTTLQLVGRNFVPIDTFGNSSLKPETATNYSGGVVIEAGGFDFNVDYFKFKLRDLIVAEPAANMATALFANPGNCADPAFAALRNRFQFTNGGGVPGAGTCSLATVSRVNTRQVNAAAVNTSGIDVQLTYHKRDVFGGTLGLGGSLSYVIDYNVSDLSVEGILVQSGFDAAGKLNSGTIAYPLPRWKGQAFVDYGHGIFSARATLNYIGSYRDQRDTLFVPRVDLVGLSAGSQQLNGQKIGAFTTADISLRAQLATGTTINLTVLNVTDEDPPFARLNYNYDPFTASALKRQLKIGVTQSF
ncbi:TonB-dependent receptor [Sphingomonas sp. TREG-RG-20F-R18-01]|uniref:TonB-dependent receptor domain-containing protein n=1 Tax=Sphingomonas sp. TREG-RG-20F-R18-01 TaxID=2914982 RepID=UPI001F58717F|nr:TonB-dependent receptor [Sphingomonas sp. TREG-RG-20F-R18-01]